MLVNTTTSVCQSEIIRKALSMLELMDRSVEDNLIFNHVALMLEDYDEKKSETEQLLCSLISLILSSFSTHLPSGDPLSVQIKMLQFRLMAPVTNTEQVALQHYVESCADIITQKNNISFSSINTTLEPLLHSFGLDNKKPYFKAESISSNQNNASSSEKRNANNVWELDVSEFGKSIKHLFSSNYLRDSIEQSEKFGVLLEVELASLKNTDDIQEFNNKKQFVLNEMEKILSGHQEMMGYFQKMSEFITLMQKDSLRLNEELDRVTLLSMTDELTGLPNRRAFFQRLKDEVGRVKRYGHNLTMALLDLDYFKPINDKYGHHAGDKVLRSYASDVLSVFREQDMIARYGGEEFVVIFPNTASAGALQALNMVQSRAEEVRITINDVDINLPTFSAGLVTFRPGESIDSFVQRADEVLYAAKKKGRNRIEVELEAELS